MRRPSQCVLFVGDDEKDYFTVRDLLAQVDPTAITVSWANSYEAAREAFSQPQHDICLLNYRLGHHSGLDILQEFCAGSRLPFILISDIESYEIDVAAANLGAADYLVNGQLTAMTLERSIRHSIQRIKTEKSLLQAQRFALSTVDALPGNIAVIDEQGLIVAVNAAWRDFAASHHLVVENGGLGANYLEICDSNAVVGGPVSESSIAKRSVTSGSVTSGSIANDSIAPNGRVVTAEIRAVMAGVKDSATLEYPCHTSHEQRWFEVRATRFSDGDPLHLVVSHEDITRRKLAEQQFRIHSEMLDIIGQAVIVTDQVGTISYWNAFAEKLYGWADSEVVGRNISQVIPNDATREQAETALHCLKEGESWSGEFTAQKRDGTSFPAFVTDTPVRDEHGYVISIISLSHDIGERKHAEETLRQSEANLAKAQQIAHIGSWEKDLTHQTDLNETPLHWSDEVYRIFGYQPGQIEVSFQTFLESVHPDDRDLVTSTTAEALQSGQFSSFEHRILWPDGTERVVREQSEVVFDEMSGVPLKLVGTVEDITERKKSESQLHFQKTLLEAQTEASLDGILVVSGEGRILSYNRRFLEMWNIPQDTLTDGDDAPLLKTVVEQVANQQPFLDKVKDLYEHREQRSHEEIVLLDGRVFDRYSAPITSGDGLYYGRVWYFHDITERKQALASTARLAAIVESSDDAIIGKTLDGIITSWNASAEILYGYMPHEVIGRAISVLAPPDRLDEQKYLLNRIAQGERVANYETVRVCKDGRLIDVSLTLSAVKNEAGEILGASAISRDISDRKRAENALRDSEARSSAVIQYALDCIITIDHESRVVEFNPAAETTFGYTRAEALGKNLNDLILPLDYHESHTQGIAHYLKTGEGPLSNGRIELPALCKNGKEITIELAATAIAHSDPPLFTAYLRDITERNQAEAALRDSEERFQSIVANVPGMVYQFVLQPDGTVEWPFVSEGCREIYGVEPEAIQRNPNFPVDATHPDDRDSFDQSVMISAQTLQPWRWEGRRRLDAGKTRWLQGVARPQKLPNGGTLWDGLVIDITARKEAEEQRDRFFTVSLDLLGVVNFEGNFERVNPAFMETLGFTEEELMSFPFRERVHPEDLAATQAAVETLSMGNRLVGFENRYITKNGAWRWLEWKSVADLEQGLIYAAARDITQRKESEVALLQMRDELEERVEERTAELAHSNVTLQGEITERKRAEREVRAQARQHEAVADLGRRALLDLDLDTLFQAAVTLVSVTMDVDICSLWELVPGTDILQRCAATGVTDAQMKSTVEMKIGDNFQICYAASRNELVISEDLESETRFRPTQFLVERGITSAITIPIYDGVLYGVLSVCSTQKQKFGQNETFFLQTVANVLSTAIARKQAETEILQLNRDLQEVNKRLNLENTERQMALGALHETAEILKKSKEEAELAREESELANRAKSEFLSRMSHELRTPLNAILGFAQILEMRADDPKQIGNIQQILKAGRHLLALINEVLDIARIESGHLSLSLEPISIGNIVGEILDLMRPLAASRQIQLINELTRDGADRHLLADQQRLKQILLNLLSNAVKYNCDGGLVNIWCETLPSAPVLRDGIRYEGQIRFLVRDTGAGIAADDIAKLFVPFERLGAGNSQIEGTGIGLTLCKHLVEAMSGQIGVHSEIGEGSTFWVQLPLVSSPLQQNVRENAHGAAPSQSTNPVYSGTILYIEDNLSNISLVEHALAIQNHQLRFLTAMQGSVGLDLAFQHLPDLILLDIHLPDMTGDLVLNRLKAQAATRNIPVVMLSADATPSQIERLLKSGAEAYVTKPLDLKKFFGLLNRLMDEIMVKKTG